MKRLLFTLTTVLFCVVVFAQSPEKMSYQSVVRDTKGNLLKNTTIGVQVSILQGDINGALVYAETQLPVTNANGLATLVIGEGKTVSGSISSIDWSNGPYFIKTETDPSADGGTNYTITGTSQLLSVPFALHATTAEKLTNPAEETDPVFSAWDKSTGIKVSESQITDLKHFTNADETDPGYTADSSFIKTGVQSWDSSLAKTISTEDTARWGKAETDPLFSSWDKSTGITVNQNQISGFDPFTTADETDPVFGKSVAKGITQTDTAIWNNKSGFSGNYADLANKPTNVSSFANDAGYQKATDDGDTDPTNEIQYIYRTGNKIGIRDGGWVSVAEAESDPWFSASQAATITSSDVTHIKNLSGINTGDQDLSSLATKTALADSTAQVRSEIPDVSGFLTTEIDPTFTSSQAANITVTDITSLGNLSGINTGNQDLSPLATKTALGDSTAQVRSAIPDVSGFLSTETDPTFTASQAANITVTDITHLGNLTGKNTGDQDLSPLATKTALGDSTALLRSEIPTIAAGSAIGDMQYWNGTAWVTVAAGTTGQLLSVNAAGSPEWQNPSSLKSAYTNIPTTDASGVIFNGVVNANGLSTTVAFEYGTDTSYGTTVTATQSPVSSTTNTAVTSTLITVLTLGSVYHVRIVTQNIFGTFYGNDFTFTNLYYGASYAGGLVFTFDNAGHGVVCEPTDPNKEAVWYNAIIICNNLVLSGYYDWNLPTLYELNLMYRNHIGGFISTAYWSSTQSIEDRAWMMNFNGGFPFTCATNSSGYIRAVRDF